MENPQTATSTNNNQNTQVELIRTHSKEPTKKHHKASLGVESTRTAKAARKYKNTWRRVLTSDLKKIGKAWGEAKIIEKDR